MTITSSADITLTQSWVDITVGTPALANADVAIQNKIESGAAYLVIGGNSAPTSETAGYRLGWLETWKVNGVKLWMRTDSAKGGPIAAGVIA